MIRKPPTENPSGLEWRKSSYSSGSEGDSCVEVAAAPDSVHVRDSKNLPGPQLTFRDDAWAHFVPYAAGR